jgi:hypothetical protein
MEGAGRGATGEEEQGGERRREEANPRAGSPGHGGQLAGEMPVPWRKIRFSRCHREGAARDSRNESRLHQWNEHC